MLLAPGTPMLFQGQEFGASSPFLFFADHGPELAKQIRQGRAKFLAQFRSLATPEMQERFADPGDPATFERSKLDHSERQSHREIYDLHRDLLKLRREEPAFRAQKRRGVDGAVLSSEAFVLRFFGGEGAAGDERLLIVNLGIDLHLDPAPEPLLAPRPIPYGPCCGRAKIPGMAASERRHSTPMRTGKFPATLPCC